MGWRYLTIVIALTEFSGTSSAYPVPIDFDGALNRWKISGPEDLVYFEVVNDSSLDITTAAQLVSSSTALWSAVPGSNLRLASVSDTAGATAKITVNFNSAFDGGNFAAAYAAMDELDLEGNPAHCSVHVAIRGGEADSDLEKTVLHELGHCLGLGHSLFPKAIMSYRLEENTFALDVDDLAAIGRLYSDDASSTAIPPGCTIGKMAPKNRKASDIKYFFDPFILFLPLIVWLTARRLRG